MKSRKALKRTKLGLAILVVFCASIAPRLARAQVCNDKLTIVNNSKYNVYFNVNGVPLRILAPGQTIEGLDVLNDGANKVSVQGVLNAKGELNPKIVGPKPFTVTGECAKNQTHTLTYVNKSFHSAGKKAASKKPKKVGNAGGRDLELDGVWSDFDKECRISISDGGFVLTAAVNCGTVLLDLQGTRFGGSVLFFGRGLDVFGRVVSAALSLGVFEDIEDDETGKSYDVLKGSIFLDKNKEPVAFLRERP